MTVRYEIEGPVAVVTIDRPDARNAVDRPTADALVDAFTRFDADDALAVAVLTGARRHVLRRRRPQGDGRTRRRRGSTGWRSTATARWARPGMPLDKPVIAAHRGPRGRRRTGARAVVRSARRSPTTRLFGVFCRRWGVPLIDGGTVRLPRIIGQGPALDLILTGRAVDADEALQPGPGHAGRAVGQRARRRGRARHASWRRSPRAACATTVRRCTRSGTSTSPTPCAARPSSGSTRCARPARSTAPRASPAAPAATAPPPDRRLAPLAGMITSSAVQQPGATTVSTRPRRRRAAAGAAAGTPNRIASRPTGTAAANTHGSASAYWAAVAWCAGSPAASTAPNNGVPTVPPSVRARQRGRRRHAHVGDVDRVLHREDRRLHREPDADPDDGAEARRRPRPTVSRPMVVSASTPTVIADAADDRPGAVAAGALDAVTGERGRQPRCRS